METRPPGFIGEYLWELDIARTQLLALSEAAPGSIYAWRPVHEARTFSAVLVHVAAGNVALLHMAGAPSPLSIDLYGPAREPAAMEAIAAMIRKNTLLERTLTEKQPVIDFLRRSFDTVRDSLAAGAGHLDTPGDFFGERTTVRRVYMRILTHSHEHMGQAVAWVRTYGLKAPWPDPLREFDEVGAPALSTRAAAGEPA